jgi:acetyl esterase/lipase
VKVRVLSGLLAVSLTLNVAGLVFFIGFLNLSGHYKTLKRQRSEMEHSLNVIKTESLMPGSSQAGEIFRRTFISQVDGEPDAFAVMPPSAYQPNTDYTLVVYLHGMGSNYMEPFTAPAGEPLADALAARNHSLVILSCNYRKLSSWGSDNAIADISQNIHEVSAQYPIKRIVMMGTSMGGCTALTYVEKAPADIKQKIVGVVSVESAGDLASLYHLTRHPMIQPALIAAAGGAPEQVPEAYRKLSFIPNLDQFPDTAAVCVVSARSDIIVPPQLQKDVVSALESKHVPVKMIEIDGAHGAPPAPVYLQALDFVLPGKETAYVR